MNKNIDFSKIYNVAIIGAGPAGLAAALRCHELGIKDILLIERDSFLGGILPQCIHSGFGLKVFKKELTGPQYCQEFIDKIADTAVNIMLNTMALEIKPGNSAKKSGTCLFNIMAANKHEGFRRITSKSIILALGCRERTRGQIMIAGARPAGILTAGLAQRMVNIEGYLPGKEIIILGSGDIGLIMARRLALEGCKVKGVYELMPFSTGLLRNIAQCLDDYNIPLFLSHTITNIFGNKRLEGVEVTPVDKNLEPDFKKAKKIKCDTLLLSVGLIPENELSKTCSIEIDNNTGGPKVDENFQTSVPGIFSCGNSLFVYDIVDEVTEDGYEAAESAMRHLAISSNGKDLKINSTVNTACPIFKPGENIMEVSPGENVAYVIPHKISGLKDINFKIRARKPLKDAVLEIEGTAMQKFSKKIKYVNPGEMIVINVLKDYFIDLTNTLKYKQDAPDGNDSFEMSGKAPKTAYPPDKGKIIVNIKSNKK